MGRIIPENLPDDFITQNPDLRAEAEIFHSLKAIVESEGINLNVLYDNSFVKKNWKGDEKDGQNDFICWNDKGVVILEVKGGLISCEEGAWFTTTLKARKKIALKESPFDQCRKNKYKIEELIYESFQAIDEKIRKETYPIKFLDVLAFPDMHKNDDLLSAAQAHSRVIFKDDLENIVFKIYEFLSTSNHRSNFLPPHISLDRAMKIFKPTFDIKLRDYVDKLNQQIKNAEKNLSRQLRVLTNIKRAIFKGGAGTGKSYLAVEKAKELEGAGKKVLFVTSNFALSSRFNELLEEHNTFCYSPSDLASKLIQLTKKDDNIHPEKEVFESSIIDGTWQKISYIFNYLPKYSDPERKKIVSIDFFQRALERNLNEIMIDNSLELYDSLIIDEAQDFSEEFLILILSFLKNGEKGEIYLFYDDNQNLFAKSNHQNLISDLTVIPLNENFRNSRNIKNLSYKFYKGEDTYCEAPNGPEIQFIEANSLIDKKRELVKLLDEFYEQKIADFTVLQGDVLPYESLDDSYIENTHKNLSNLYLVEKENKLHKYNEVEEINGNYPFSPIDLDILKNLAANFDDMSLNDWQKISNIYDVKKNHKQKSSDYSKYPVRKIGKYKVMTVGMMAHSIFLAKSQHINLLEKYGNFDNDVIIYDYISNYKGLESDIIILVDIDRSLDIIEDVYVGLSRAKSQLYIISGKEAISKLKELNSF
tara:strand:+ start:438 stop:2549 length:2112 start_codon:yes stop_codon:yes gene_type:complete